MTKEKIAPSPEADKIIADSLDEFFAIGRSTAPADFAKAEAAITRMYARINLPPPEFVALPSPAAVEKYINKVNGTTKTYNGTWFWGSGDTLWYWHETARRLGVVFDKEDGEALSDNLDVCRSIGWWYPYESTVIMTDRPAEINFDDAMRPHGEKKAAILFRDGYALHSWHGVTIPAAWSEGKLPTAAEGLRIENMELRRAALEMIGWNNILSELKAVTVDKDVDPMVGELLEVNMPDVGVERFIRVLCGTGREFAIPVPIEMRTALEANAWTYGVDPVDYRPEVRT